MRALVVYESMFGNTQQIAEAIADGMRERSTTVDCHEVGSAPTAIPDDVDLLVVGGPTHAFGLTRASSRESAAKTEHTGSLVSTGIGIREWMSGLRPQDRFEAAVFDTRSRKPLLPGSAAKAAARRLRRTGFNVTAAAHSFWVTGTTGPLVAGEVDRATEWGRQLANTASVSSTPTNPAAVKTARQRAQP